MSNLKEHIIGVHENKKDVKCDQCEKSFNYKRLLTKHKNTVHSDETRFRCNACEKSFKYAGSLKDHICQIDKLLMKNDITIYSMF